MAPFVGAVFILTHTFLLGELLMATMQLQHPSRPRPQNWRKLLQSGDQVTWTDPDNGLCSRTLTIQHIQYLPGGIVQITDSFGGYVEAYFRELS